MSIGVRDFPILSTAWRQEAEDGALRGDYQRMYRTIRTLSGSATRHGRATIKRPDGTLCQGIAEELDCWNQHFQPTLTLSPAVASPELDEFVDAATPDAA